MPDWKDQYNAMNRTLEAASAALVEYETRIRIIRNRDNSADGELRITVKRGITINDILIDAEGAFRSFISDRQKHQQWIQIGLEIPPNIVKGEKIIPESLKIRTRKKGWGMIYPQRAKKLIKQFATARKVAADIASYGRRKPSYVYVRLHWSPRDKRQKYDSEERMGRKGKYRGRRYWPVHDYNPYK